MGPLLRRRRRHPLPGPNKWFRPGPLRRSHCQQTGRLSATMEGGLLQQTAGKRGSRVVFEQM